MSYLKSPFFIGDLELSSNVFAAPLAGCSDFPFRKMTKRYRPGLVFCEMVKIDALVRHDPNTYRLLDFSSDMHPIGAQICGSKLNIVAEAARIVEDLGFDLIDLNCGCPVDKVTKDGSGSGLLRTPDLIAEMIAKITSVVSIPVTVKIRAGWDDENIVASKITQLAEAAGAKAIFIHGRTRQQAYRGFANWDHIKAAKAAANEIKVFGNGDVFDPIAAKKMFESTGCDGVLVSRGTFGQPWIFEDIYSYLESGVFPKRDINTILMTFKEHVEDIFSYANERKALLDLKRVGCWYLKQIEGTKKFKEKLNRSKSRSEIDALIEEFSLEQITA